MLQEFLAGSARNVGAERLWLASEDLAEALTEAEDPDAPVSSCAAMVGTVKAYFDEASAFWAEKIIAIQNGDCSSLQPQVDHDRAASSGGTPTSAGSIQLLNEYLKHEFHNSGYPPSAKADDDDSTATVDSSDARDQFSPALRSRSFSSAFTPLSDAAGEADEGLHMHTVAHDEAQQTTVNEFFDWLVEKMAALRQMNATGQRREVQRLIQEVLAEAEAVGAWHVASSSADILQRANQGYVPSDALDRLEVQVANPPDPSRILLRLLTLL